MEGPKRVRRRLEPEAYDILNDYFTNVGKWPDAAAQEELAARVRRVPGCEFYTARQVYSYFANSRAKRRALGEDAASPPPGESSSSSAPKPGRRRKATRTQTSDPGLRPSQAIAEQDSTIHKLDVLLDEAPDPSPQVAQIWADTLGNGVVPEHILTYAFLRRANSTQESWHESNGQQARTEARPEPQTLRPEAPPAAQPPLQSVEPLASPEVSANPLPDRSLPQGPEEHPRPCSIVPPPPPPTNNQQAAGNSASLPESPPSLDPNTSVAHNWAGIPSPPPANLAVGPHPLVERVRDALLQADTRGARECPKTFADFARWLKAHNEDRGAA